MVNPGYTVKIAGYQLLAKEEGSVLGLGHIVISDTVFRGIAKAAFSVEGYVALKAYCPEAHSRRLFKRIIQQDFSESLALHIVSDTNRSHSQYRDIPSVVGGDMRLYENVLTDKPSVPFENEVKLVYKIGVVP